MVLLEGSTAVRGRKPPELSSPRHRRFGTQWRRVRPGAFSGFLVEAESVSGLVGYR